MSASLNDEAAMRFLLATAGDYSRGVIRWNNIVLPSPTPHPLSLSLFLCAVKFDVLYPAVLRRARARNGARERPDLLTQLRLYSSQAQKY